jgi:ankyrin repeat protein
MLCVPNRNATVVNNNNCAGTDENASITAQNNTAMDTSATADNHASIETLDVTTTITVDGMTVLHCRRRRKSKTMLLLNSNKNDDHAVSATTTQTPQSGADDDSEISCAREAGIATLESPRTEEKNDFVTGKRKPIDMGKLRDRWWDILRVYESRQSDIQKEGDQEFAHQMDQGNKLADVQVNTNTKIQDVNQTTEIGVQNDIHVDDDDDDDDDKEEEEEEEVSSTSSSQLENYYLEMFANPCKEAIQRNDTVLLERLLQKHGEVENQETNQQNHLSLLQYAVQLNLPEMVQTLCRYAQEKARRANRKVALFLDENYSPNGLPPLLLAAEKGYNECLQILLATFGVSPISFTKDLHGNNAFHCCCRGSGSSITFSLLLGHIVASSKTSGSASALFKCLACRNDQLQTPLHVACHYGRADIMDSILNQSSLSNSISLLSKLLSMQDCELQTPFLTAVSSGSTDIVMSLLMWRGNNFTPSVRPPSTLSLSHDKDTKLMVCPPCPLEWAVRAQNVEMVQLLLEFNDATSGNGYNLTNSLRVAVGIRAEVNAALEDTDLIDIFRILIRAGANPCKVPDESLTSSAKFPCSILTLAVQNHDSSCVAAILDSYTNHLVLIQKIRRKDPKLQKQPNSFFANMESVENKEKRVAMRDALVVALFLSWNAPKIGHDPSSWLTCALVLYQREAQLYPDDLDRLKSSFVAGCLVPFSPSCTRFENSINHYEAFYPRLVDDSKGKAGSPFYLSCLMRTLPWASSCSSMECAWFADSETCSNRAAIPDPDVIIFCKDGTSFHAHAFVLSRASDKFAAAIRFARMSVGYSAVDLSGGCQTIQIRVDLNPRTCQWLLEHIYHGSITSGLSKRRAERCQQLLELLLIGQEFLCRSLIQECEMRLLSCEQSYHGCFCFHCRARVRERDLLEVESNEVQVCYRVAGPSWLLTPDTVMDVLAAVEYVSESEWENEFFPIVSSDQVPSIKSPIKGVLHPPFAALREAAISIVLREFSAVGSIASIWSNVGGELDMGIDGNPHELFLHMCIHHLYDSCCNSSEPVNPKNASNDTLDQVSNKL